jgi:hypothetical protein
MLGIWHYSTFSININEPRCLSYQRATSGK